MYEIDENSILITDDYVHHRFPDDWGRTWIDKMDQVANNYHTPDTLGEFGSKWLNYTSTYDQDGHTKFPWE
jgi:hypothetical protein